jgi:hypothetical protein
VEMLNNQMYRSSHQKTSRKAFPIVS